MNSLHKNILIFYHIKIPTRELWETFSRNLRPPLESKRDRVSFLMIFNARSKRVRLEMRESVCLLDKLTGLLYFLLGDKLFFIRLFELCRWESSWQHRESFLRIIVQFWYLTLYRPPGHCYVRNLVSPRSSKHKFLQQIGSSPLTTNLDRDWECLRRPFE